MARKTKLQKVNQMTMAHNITSARYAEFSAAGVGEFSNWCRTVEQAIELKNNGITVEQWREWRIWDVTKYPLLTPKSIANYISRGMTPTDAKRELSTAHPAPMRTR